LLQTEIELYLEDLTAPVERAVSGFAERRTGAIMVFHCSIGTALPLTMMNYADRNAGHVT